MLNLRPFDLGTDVPEDRAKLICLSATEALRLCPEFAKASIQQLTPFLDIRPKPEEVTSWPPTWQMIGVFTKSNEQVPFYLREYWTTYIRRWIEDVINDYKYFVAHSNPGMTWRIVDVSTGSLVDDEIVRVDEFSYYITTTVGALKPTASIQIADPRPLGSVLNWTKQYYLRHQFNRHASSDTTITVRPIKPEKVFFVTLDRQQQDATYYVVKFDYPQMIVRERLNYARIFKVLKAKGRKDLLSNLYRVEPSQPITFGGNDILSLIASVAVSSNIPPEDLTLHRQWRAVTTEKQADQFFELVSPIFDVIAHSSKGVPVRSKADELFKKFFRKMNGFCLFKDIDQIDNLPAILDARKRRTSQYFIRRVKIEAPVSSDDLQLSIQLEPRGRERVLLRFQEFSKTEEWPSIISGLNLLDLGQLQVDPSVLEGNQQIWSNAISALRESIATGNLDDDRELTLPGQRRTLNPIKFFKEVHSGRIASFRLPDFETIQSQIHFDLHLENILMPGVDGPKLIDLASMEKGPIDYDYARMEARIILEMAATTEFARQAISKQIKLILKFEEALNVHGFKTRDVRSCPRLLRKEFAFLKRLREKREEIVEDLGTSASVTTFSKDERTLNLCLVFEYLSELFERASTKFPSTSQLLTAFVAAGYHLKNLVE
jgi:hypothetical protein